jgi:hypothetical protein
MCCTFIDAQPVRKRPAVGSTGEESVAKAAKNTGGESVTEAISTGDVSIFYLILYLFFYTPSNPLCQEILYIYLSLIIKSFIKLSLICVICHILRLDIELVSTTT